MVCARPHDIRCRSARRTANRSIRASNLAELQAHYSIHLIGHLTLLGRQLIAVNDDEPAVVVDPVIAFGAQCHDRVKWQG